MRDEKLQKESVQQLLLKRNLMCSTVKDKTDLQREKFAQTQMCVFGYFLVLRFVSF